MSVAMEMGSKSFMPIVCRARMMEIMKTSFKSLDRLR